MLLRGFELGAWTLSAPNGGTFSRGCETAICSCYLCPPGSSRDFGTVGGDRVLETQWLDVLGTAVDNQLSFQGLLDRACAKLIVHAALRNRT